MKFRFFLPIIAVVVVIAAGFLIWREGGAAKRRTETRYGAWTVRCASGHCAATMRFVDRSHKHLLLAIGVKPGRIDVLTPPDVLIRDGVQIAKATKLGFVVCTERFCRASGKLDGPDALGSGSPSVVRYRRANGRAVALKIPTKDFGAVYRALR